jgi:hypothetical protein
MWVVKDGGGQLLSNFESQSRLELARKLMGERYDVFRFLVSSSYRELFERTLTKVLERENWRIVGVRVRQRAVPLRSADPLVEREWMAGTVEGQDMWASLRTDIWEIVWLASVVTGLSLIGIVLAVVLAQFLAAGPVFSPI